MSKRNSPRPARPAIQSLLVAIAAYLALFGIMAAAISPERYDIRVGEVATLTITATKDVEDTISTQKLVDAAVRAVQPSYISDETVMPAVLGDLAEAFERLTHLTDLSEGMDGTQIEISELLIQQARDSIAPVRLSDDVLRVLIAADSQRLEKLGGAAIQLARETLNAKLPENQEGQAVDKLGRDLSALGFESELCAAATAVVSQYLRPNMLLDEETTQLNREKAAAEVEPVVYKKGQNIVRAGEVVTAPQIKMLDSLGMIKDRSMDLLLYVGLGMLVTLLFLVVVAHLYTFEPEFLRDTGRVTLLCLICVLVVLISLLVRALSSYLMPVTLGAMLIALLLEPRLALSVNLTLSVMVGLMASVDNGLFTSATLYVMLASMVSGSACVMLIRRRQQRIGVLIAGLMASVMNATCIVAVGLISSVSSANLAPTAFWAAGGGVMSAVLCIGFQPALEWMFNLVTPAKLMELSNPNQPLLRRLLMEAPGTYHHSIVVANLAEAAASAVGADGLLARVGAYYHDIGKLKRPHYFKENQISDNPHDRTDPRVSTAILTAHPRDGVEMAQKNRLPASIIEIIQQHHGDTPVLYFYDKASKQGEVDVADFRYDGPRPRSREAAIVMLADTVEAAARTMGDSTPDKMAQLIRRLVRSKMEDGQLDECALTFADLNLVCEAFMTVLTGIYHERIEYPDVAIPQRVPDEAMEAPKPESKPESKSEPKPEPKSDPKSEPKSEPRPEPKPEQKPEPKPEQKSEPKPETKLGVRTEKSDAKEGASGK